MSTRSLVRLARARAGLEPADDLPEVGPERPTFFAADTVRGLTYGEWYAPVELLAACLRRHGLHTGERVLLLAETRLEWLQADLAIMAAGGMSVPVYPTLPAGQIEEILRGSGARIAFVANRVLLDELLSAPSAERLALCILLPPAHPSDDAGRAGGVTTLAWDEAIAAGTNAPPDAVSRIEAIVRGLGPDDPATLIYTSGTSGCMKGVVLTHGNLLSSAVTSAGKLMVGPEDAYLSFLPMAHVLERVVQLSMLWAGARVSYSAGLDRLEADLRRTRPTVVVGVPRLYEKILRGAAETARAKGPRAYLLFRMAEHAAVRAGRRGPGRRPKPPAGWLWDLLVYRRVRRALGGRARLLISGGAPLGSRELSFLSGAGLVLVEGYGLTETASVVTVGTPVEWKRGSVGRPLPGTEIRLDADGEILVRGPSVMRGYWDDEAGTAEALAGGWLHTGDVGRFDEDGFLFLTDRKKDLIVTAHGKKVAPQMIETRLRGSPVVSEVVVTGDRRPFLVALVYPDLDVLRVRTGLALPEGPQLRETLRAAGVRALFRAEIDRACEGLAPHETVREFLLLAERPGVGDGSMTPTQKLRRGEIERRHAAEVRALYDGESP